MGHQRWGISEADPYVWIKLCNNGVSISGQSFPPSDYIFYTDRNIRTVAQSLIDDINNMEGTFLKLELFPEDVDNIPATSYYDSTLAKERTIEYCGKKLLFPFAAGLAKPEISGNRITGCEIQINKDLESEGVSWARTFVHELGHCIGLDHPQEVVDAIMSYFSASGEFRYLIDDKMGIVTLYPARAAGDLETHNTLGLKCSFRD